MKDRDAKLLIGVLFIAAAFYVGYKHHKETGFWYGVLAAALFGLIGFGFSVKVGA